MDEQTQRRLNQINRDFYRLTAAEFDATRQRPWGGWERMLDAVDLPLASVLDIGCGNGRLARFLAGRQAEGFAYIGVDNSPELLAYARCQDPRVKLELIEQDVILGALPARSAQLVALFGLLHHVPGAERRRQLLREAAGCVLPGGALVLAAWRFHEQERFRRRIVPWPQDIAVEKHDYLLDWRRGERALRYCHYIDDEEHAQLVGAAGLPVIADYRADGGLNRYTVMRRETAERADPRPAGENTG